MSDGSAGERRVPAVGSRAQVMHGTAACTSGGLTKKDLTYNKQGRIVSRKKQRTARKDRRLEKAGYFTKKGQFGSFKKTAKKSRKGKRGGGLLSGRSNP
jgi:hypothetical protein